MFFTDEYERPLPTGPTVMLWPYSPHVGCIGYPPSGQQVVGHNSKTHGKVVVTLPEIFNEGLPLQYLYPLSIEDGERVWQNIVDEAARGVRWAAFNNCQDLLSRANTGHDGRRSWQLLNAPQDRKSTPLNST